MSTFVNPTILHEVFKPNKLIGYLINSIKILISFEWSSSTELICEPSHFKRINHQSELEKHLGPCSAVANVEDIYFPAFNPKSKQCILQQQHMLFSCVGEHPDFSRLCPCRSYMEGQTALCTTCLWRQWWWYDVTIAVGNKIFGAKNTDVIFCLQFFKQNRVPPLRRKKHFECRSKIVS